MADLEPCPSAESLPEPSAIETIPAPPPADDDSTVACDLCRRELVLGDAYHLLELTINDEPFLLGQPEPLVEESSVFTCCARCKPALDERLNVLIHSLWELRADDAPPVAAGLRPGEKS